MELKITRVGSDGEGIAYINKKPVFVYYAYLDEVVKVDLFTNKRGFLEGNLKEIIIPSKHRRENIYSNLQLNTASNLMHINYFEQLKFKRRTMQFLVNSKIRKNNIKVLNTVEANDEFHYRNKIDLPIRYINGKNKMGLYVRGSQDFIPIDSYITHQKILDEKINKVLSLMDKYNINAYNNKNKKGFVSHLSLRANLKDQVQLTFILRKDVNLNKIINELKNDKEIVSIYKIVNNRNSFDIFEGKQTHLAKDLTLDIQLTKYHFPLMPKAFFQLNTNQALKLYERIVSISKLSKDDVVLDAYSGVGTIATFISPYVKEVVAIERTKDSVRQMDESLKINKITNVKTITGDVLKVANYLKTKFDVMIFDPPRLGLGSSVIKFILKQKPKKIIYTSCNPETLVADINELKDYYNIFEIEPFDMFPNTSQIESITVLHLKEGKL